MLILEIATVLILVIIMSYFNAIETAYSSVDLTKLNFNDINDKKKLTRLKVIIKKKGFFISAIKSLITFCELWLSALIVEIVAMPLYRKLIVDMKIHSSILYIIKYVIILVVTILLSYSLYIFATTIPKTIAIKKKDKIIKDNINAVYIIPYIFAPISKVMIFTEKVILLLFKVKRKEEISYKDSEMKETVEVSKELGIISKKDSLVISNYLKLDELTAEDIMIPIENATMIDINSSKNEIKDTIINYGYTRIPVYDNDKRKIIGIINTKNVLKSILSHEKISTTTYLKDCMKISPGKRIDLLFGEMLKQKEHMAIVIKEKDIAIGIVTMEDIFEEIGGGNIEDDFEKYKMHE